MQITSEFLKILKKYLHFIFFRHVVLPREIAKKVPQTHLMTESEWRSIGVQQSKGWIHYMRHEPGMIYVITPSHLITGSLTPLWSKHLLWKSKKSKFNLSLHLIF